MTLNPRLKMLSRACVKMRTYPMTNADYDLETLSLFNRHVNTLMEHYHYAIIPKKVAEPRKKKALRLAEPHFPAMKFIKQAQVSDKREK